jgi:hypothetical protein
MTGHDCEEDWARLDAASRELLTERPGATYTGVVARAMRGIWLIDLHHAMYSTQADPDQLRYFLHPVVREFVTAKAVRRWVDAERSATDAVERRQAAQRRGDWARSRETRTS